MQRPTSEHDRELDLHAPRALGARPAALSPLERDAVLVHLFAP